MFRAWMERHPRACSVAGSGHGTGVVADGSEYARSVPIVAGPVGARTCAGGCCLAATNRARPEPRHLAMVARPGLARPSPVEPPKAPSGVRPAAQHAHARESRLTARHIVTWTGSMRLSPVPGFGALAWRGHRDAGSPIACVAGSCGTRPMPSLAGLDRKRCLGSLKGRPRPPPAAGHHSSMPSFFSR